MKLIRYLFLLPLLALWACSDDDPQEAQTASDIYITADLSGSDSRVAYDFAHGEGLNSSGNIRAFWQLGDIIKVYETDAYGDATETYSDCYHDYEAYNAAHPYPSAPQVDKYYRFVCVGGEGTTRGVFKYIGLATATVIENPTTQIRNVHVDIKYNHKIRNWDKFQGLVIYGNPLRNSMMRTQTAKNDLTHLRFGERMYGYMCAHNFQWGSENPTLAAEGAAGADRLVLKNVGGCVYRVIIGGIDTDIYGGSTLSLEMPGVTDQGGIRNEPMTLTLGSADDFQLGIEPWSKAEDPNNAFCAYIVGWPGTLPANQVATVTLTEHLSKNVYTWELSSTEAITFEEGPYYTIDLRNHEYTKTKQ